VGRQSGQHVLKEVGEEETHSKKDG